MADGGKRKDAPGGGEQQNKKKKTGNAGKWKTTHQQSKMVIMRDSLPQPGDTGIWVTCARHQELKAGREVIELFNEYAEKMYGIKIEEPKAATDEEDEQDDIDASIQKEIAAMNTKKAPGDGGDENQIFTLMKMNVDCLLFVKTKAPIEPVEFVRRICLDAKEISRLDQMKCRYVNRFTPAPLMGKATEAGIVEVAREALEPFFDLSGKRDTAADTATEAGESSVGKSEVGKAEAEAEAEANTDAPAPAAPTGDEVQPKDYKPLTYALRPTIRNHSKLKRDFLINEIAGLINSDLHKVNLTSPDKVVLIDLYQAVCSMSVVDKDWDDLKKYNLFEIYKQAVKNNSSGSGPGAVPETGAE
ncbi:tRNA acetyltransferase TAN1 [Rhypophila decipiens]|uniref:tRNA acetyltransferase TAN1 n=1 Tax=Rhypophila decipiens TaxID=261697 RepID=A0AAN6YC79_9PEZI|nr:tRNA acetyltransferase TAN1 [Rhypophila decipiens]